MNAVENYLKEDNWKYEIIDDGVFRIGIRLHSKLQHAKMYILVYKEDFTVTAVSPIGADEKTMSAVAEFITRVNYNLLLGGFEMDYDDGEDRYHSSMHCGSTPPTKEQIAHLVYITGSMLDRYGDALAKVIYGFASPREVLAEAEA